MSGPAGSGARVADPVTDRPLIAVIDYGIGNLHSAQKSLERVGADARLTRDPGLIADAAGVVLPGVGAFGAAMAALRAHGLEDLTVDAAGSGRPFLGICIGMQMLCAASEEDPGVAGLGVFDVEIVRIRRTDGRDEHLKLPQMQWNQLRVREPGHPVLAGLDDGAWMYFVHSFAAVDGPDVVATCDYGGEVVAALGRGPVAALQFHPEKSSTAGLALLTNFLELCRSPERV